jgi:hypothetical protein
VSQNEMPEDGTWELINNCLVMYDTQGVVVWVVPPNELNQEKK